MLDAAVESQPVVTNVLASVATSSSTPPSTAREGVPPRPVVVALRSATLRSSLSSTNISRTESSENAQLTCT